MTRASDLARLMGAGGTLNAALSVDTISEKTSGSGVTIDSLNIKDSGIGGSQIGGRRNIVINGAMQVAQRGTSQTGITASANEGYSTVDRFAFDGSGHNAVFTATQSTDAPTGFSNSLKMDCTTADTSIGASDYLMLQTRLEGFDVQQLKKGTSSAEKVTVSFYVKGNASATYTCELQDDENGRTNGQLFSVTTDWTRVVLTFDGDTTGTIPNDNTIGLRLNMWFHVGSTYDGGTFTSNQWTGTANQRVGSITSFFDSTDRTFFLTGVQLELGSQATPFEHRSFGEELALCQRYFYKYEGCVVEWIYCEGAGASLKFWAFQLPVSMRAVPSFSHGFSHGTSNGVQINSIALTGSSDSRILLRVTYASDSGSSNTMHHTDGWNGEYAFLSAEL